MTELPELSEAALAAQVRLAQKGDSQAFSMLIRATEKRLFRFSMYLTGDRALAQDLCQDTYIRALEKLGRLKEPDRFVGWLLKSAKNLYLDHVKSPKNKAKAVAIEDVPESALQQQSSDRDLFLQIQEAMTQLEPEDRLILLLVDLEEHTYLEAAKIIGISESSLRFRLHHIRKDFAIRFK